MNGVLEKHLVLALDQRLAVFRTHLADGSLLENELQLHTVVYLISEIVRPCCCMLCNKDKLAGLLRQSRVCCANEQVIAKLAELVYNDLARCNGLG